MSDCLPHVKTKPGKMPSCRVVFRGVWAGPLLTPCMQDAAAQTMVPARACLHSDHIHVWLMVYPLRGERVRRRKRRVGLRGRLGERGGERSGERRWGSDSHYRIIAALFLFFRVLFGAKGPAEARSQSACPRTSLSVDNLLAGGRGRSLAEHQHLCQPVSVTPCSSARIAAIR